MRILLALAALASTAHADPIQPRVNIGVARVGAAHVADATGMAVGFFAEGGFTLGALSAGIEVGIGEVCREPNDNDCEGPTDLSFALHLRHRIRQLGPHRLWLGGGPAVHGIWADSSVAARGEIETAASRWQPGLDLVFAIELRGRDRELLSGHIGVRAFAMRSDEPAMTKPFSTPADRGVDGGVVLEVGYLIGR